MPENDERPDESPTSPSEESTEGSTPSDWAEDDPADELVDEPADELRDEPVDELRDEPVDALSGEIPDELSDADLADLTRTEDDLAPGAAVEQLLPALEETGHDGVDVALATLDDLASTSVHEHVAVFEATHEELRRALNDVSAAPSPDSAPQTAPDEASGHVGGDAAQDPDWSSTR